MFKNRDGNATFLHQLTKEWPGAEWCLPTLNQACFQDDQEAQCAFKILMIHEELQFALRIAFRCALHRCGTQDIPRQRVYYPLWGVLCPKTEPTLLCYPHAETVMTIHVIVGWEPLQAPECAMALR